jgi:hypothetical protein
MLAPSQQPQYTCVYFQGKTMGRKENKVEAYLQKRVAEMGGFTRKVVYQGRAGAPDQWCFFPGGRMLIVECKAEDGTVSAVQVQEIRQLIRYGFEARIAYTKEDVDEYLKGYE